MIPPSLARLIEKWRADTYGIVELAEDCDASVKCCHEQCADELSAALQSMTAEEPVPVNDTLKKLVDKFLAWPLPASVCPDLCTNVSKDTYPGQRIGTMLLTAIEAEEMIKYLGLYPCPCHPAVKQAMRSHEVELRCSHLNGCKNIMDELKEHTNAAQGEDAYLRIYPCDAREILAEFAHPPLVAAKEIEGDAEACALEIAVTQSEQSSRTASPLSVKQLTAIIRKHFQHSQERAGWVKCSDELPPIGEEVVCFVPNATVGHPVRALVRLLRHEDGPEYYWNTSCYANHHVASAVTHWHREPAAPLAGEKP